MKRWPMLTFWGVSTLLVGCASSVQVGLANAPRLGGAGLADERVNDVIANAGDGCGRYAESARGPLRGRIPPCPTAAHPAPLGSPAAARTDRGLGLPWLQHFYVGWPCPRAVPATEKSAAAWASVAPSPACAVP